MSNTTSLIEQETSRIIYKGHIIVQGWDCWGQRTTIILGICEPQQFWSIKDAKRFLNNEEMSCEFDPKTNTFNQNPLFKKH